MGSTSTKSCKNYSVRFRKDKVAPYGRKESVEFVETERSYEYIDEFDLIYEEIIAKNMREESVTVGDILCEFGSNLKEKVARFSSLFPNFGGNSKQATNNHLAECMGKFVMFSCPLTKEQRETLLNEKVAVDHIISSNNVDATEVFLVELYKSPRLY